jgi:Protein of unknown function (DUF5672)
MHKLDLRDVDICACSSVNLQLTARALTLSMAACDFGDAVLLSDIAIAGPFRNVRIDRLASRADYSAFVLKQLLLHTRAPFVLIVQWDGYVLDPRSWIPEFRRYDYVGAKWPKSIWRRHGMNVGNGGFSLRSRRLLEALAEPNFEVLTTINEDEYICRLHRPLLESKYAIQFAPEAIADRFAYERCPPEGPTFGFHGLFNMWRHIEDAEMIKVVEQIESCSLRSQEYAEILMQYFRLRKFGPLLALYRRLRAGGDLPEVHAHLVGILGNKKPVRDCVLVCERQLALQMD